MDLVAPRFSVVFLYLLRSMAMSICWFEPSEARPRARSARGAAGAGNPVSFARAMDLVALPRKRGFLYLMCLVSDSTSVRQIAKRCGLRSAAEQPRRGELAQPANQSCQNRTLRAVYRAWGNSQNDLFEPPKLA